MTAQMLPIAKTSSWNQPTIEQYLKDKDIPIRLSCIDDNGFPLVCSLWFQYDAGALWCATHKSAKIINLLKANPKCGFEISVNDIPYKGVRGTGEVELIKASGETVLHQLIDRYLGDNHSPLAQWLLSRAEDEYAIKINIHRITAWDFSKRMGN